MTLARETTERLTLSRLGRRAWLRVGAAATHARVYVNGEFVGEHVGAWTPFEFEITAWLRDANEIEVRCADCLHFSNGFLPTIGVRWTGARDLSIRDRPSPPTLPAPQRASVRAQQLLIDGAPFRVRGILHWGYYPELGHASPPEAQMRREIAELQALGFNLIKFCLWIPPPRYFELCDELGMLAWQEYPTWNAPLAAGSLPRGYEADVPQRIAASEAEIAALYREYFLQDRAYPCIVLRTLTCENDHIDEQLAARIIDDARRLVPGCLIADNSAWLCSQRIGDFHDEHPYVHNALWRYYGRRMRARLARPLLLGETMVVDTLASERAAAADATAPRSTPADLRRSYDVALAVRRAQIETLARDLPDAGYVVCALRDLKRTPLGLYTHDGIAKYTPQQWSWHNARPGPPRESPPLRSAVIGPRKGQWKCPTSTWWSPIVRVLDAGLPADLIAAEAPFDLLTGRVLSHCEGTRILIEQWDLHGGSLRRHPLVIEFRTDGQWRIVSALRHDTPVGRELWSVLESRQGDPRLAPPPEVGPLTGTSIVLSDWRMSLDTREWIEVKCDTPLVNDGANIFEGWATFRTRFEHPGGSCTLRCEDVGDYYEIDLDGHPLGSAGPRAGTWDGTRDIPRDFALELARGSHALEFRVRDWRAGGGMVGPVFLAADLSERIF